MPKSQLDWLGVVSLWLGAAIMAVKAADLTVWGGMPGWLTANWWSYVPLALISIYLGLAIYRLWRPEAAVVLDQPSEPDGSRAMTDAEKQAEVARLREHSKLINSLYTAQANARIAVARNNTREAEAEFPQMKAALLTVRKVFDVPIPREGKNAIYNLEAARRFLEKVTPLLKAGHVDEARAEAQAFIARIGQSPDPA